MGRALGETDPWGDGSVSGLIGRIKCPTYRAVMQVETRKKMLLSTKMRDMMLAVRPEAVVGSKRGRGYWLCARYWARREVWCNATV